MWRLWPRCRQVAGLLLGPWEPRSVLRIVPQRNRDRCPKDPSQTNHPNRQIPRISLRETRETIPRQIQMGTCRPPAHHEKRSKRFTAIGNDSVRRTVSRQGAMVEAAKVVFAFGNYPGGRVFRYRSVSAPPQYVRSSSGPIASSQPGAVGLSVRDKGTRND